MALDITLMLYGASRGQEESDTAYQTNRGRGETVTRVTAIFTTAAMLRSRNGEVPHSSNSPFGRAAAVCLRYVKATA